MPSSFDSPTSDSTPGDNHPSPCPLESTSALDNINHADQSIELFLQQVTDYNAQQLRFDHRITNPNGLSDSRFYDAPFDSTEFKNDSATPNLSHLLGLKNHSLTDTPPGSSLASPPIMPQRHSGEVPSSSSSAAAAAVAISSSSNKGEVNVKQKAKEGSSLLHVFSNPLLHAIPMLARNCLNFEDFLTQAAVQGRQNGLLGSKDSNEFTSPDTLMLESVGDNSTMITKNERPWHVKVLGLPSSGAKSRVETQIKIVLQLTNSSGKLATTWSHLKLPEHMVARDKLKKRNQIKATGTSEMQLCEDKSDMTDSEVLKVEAAVVCDGHADNEIIMCSSCVHRERKRTKRKRDNKVARASNKEGSAAKLAALFANELPDLSNENVMAEERKKILLFNSNEYVEFSKGETTLPTRITCYCRHHGEKVGFRIVFTLKDYHNHVIGTGSSPPIMITDDHKSLKSQSSVPTTSAIAGRKRSLNDDGKNDAGTPSSSKRKTTSNAEVESDSGVSSPITSAPTTPASNPEDATSIPKPEEQSEVGQTSRSSSFDSGPYNGIQNNSDAENPLLRKQITPESSDSFMIVDSLQQGGLFDFLNSNNLDIDHITSVSSNSSTINDQQIFDPQQFRHQHRSSLENYTLNQQQQQQQHQRQQNIESMMHQQEQLLSHLSQHPLQPMSNRHRTAINHRLQQSTNNDNIINGAIENAYSKILQKRQTTSNNNASKTGLPRLHRLIPSEGPIYGGSEVTVLGSNFYEGLTCLFGENPAVPTHCWSANTLLCILPPALSAGPVVVSFKEHPLMLESQDVVMFTYFDESDRALMELALQVVGLKTMGKVEDARQIAMRIVQGGSRTQTRRNNNNNRDATSKGRSASTTARIVTTTHRISYRHFLTAKAAQATYDNAHMLFYTRLEEQIMAALVAASMMKTTGFNDASQSYIRNCISLTNKNQHTLLHLAAIRGYDRLVRILVHLECDVNQTDRNGFTALHFASWTGQVLIANILLDKTDWRIQTVTGKTALQLACDAGHHSVVTLFERRQQQRQQQQQQQQQQHHHHRHDQQQFDLAHTSRRRQSTTTLSYYKRSESRSKMSSPSTLTYTTSSSSNVRVPLIDILPSSAAVSSAKSILPEQLFNMLSSMYIISINTSCVQQLSQSVSTVYTSMLDPF